MPCCFKRNPNRFAWSATKTYKTNCTKNLQKNKNTTKLIACQRHICSSHCQRDVPNDRFVRDNRIQPVSEGTEIWNALWSIPPACWRQPEIASLNSLQGKKNMEKMMTSKSEVQRGYVSLVWNMQTLASSQNCWFLPNLICFDWVVWLRNCALQKSIFRCSKESVQVFLGHVGRTGWQYSCSKRRLLMVLVNRSKSMQVLKFAGHSMVCGCLLFQYFCWGVRKFPL